VVGIAQPVFFACHGNLISFDNKHARISTPRTPTGDLVAYSDNTRNSTGPHPQHYGISLLTNDE
jgi:hypothetical protein